MPRSAFILSVGCFLSVLSALLLFGLGALSWAQEFGAEPFQATLYVESLPRTLRDLRPGEEVLIAYRVTNLTNKPVRLLGAKGFCMPWWRRYGVNFSNDTKTPIPVPRLPTHDESGWVTWIAGREFPCRVAPGSSREITLSMWVRSGVQPCDFSGAATLYSDAVGCEQTSLEIAGRIVSFGKR